VLGLVLMHSKIAGLEDTVAENDRILLDLTTRGEKLLADKKEREKEEARFERELPPLPGLLERLAGEAGIEIPESRELPDDLIGKKWVRKSVEVRLRRVGLKPIVDFMVKVENENKRIPIAITHVNIKRRVAEPDSYDIDITVSAYAKASPGKKKGKDKTGAKEGGGSAEEKEMKTYGPEV